MVSAIIQELRVDGVEISLTPASTLKANGNQAAIERWSSRIREHKISITAILRLETLAHEFNHPADDLLHWYRHDLEDLGEFPLERVRAVVVEYLSNRAAYRKTHNEATNLPRSSPDMYLSHRREA